MLVLKNDMLAHVGAVLDAVARQQLALSALKMMHVRKPLAQQWLEFHCNKTELARAVDQLSLRPIVAMELVAEKCVDKVQLLATQLQARFGAADGEIEAAPTMLEAQRQREFFFSTAHGPTARLQDCTCCVVLPHILKEGQAGKVVEAIQASGHVQITAMELFRLDRTTAAEFLEVYEGVVPHFNETVDHFTTGPCLAMELTGQHVDNVVAAFREHAGPWDVDMAKELMPHTLRAKFGQDRVRNAVHCTDLAEDGVLEAEYFFEILSKRQLKN